MFLLELLCLVNEVVEHKLLLEIDTDELSGRRLHDVLDSLREAGLDVDVDLHLHGLGRVGRHLQAPDEDVGLVGGRTHEELAVLVGGLVADDHRRGVLQMQDLRDALLRAGMGVQNLLDSGLLVVAVDVPNFELSTLGAHEQMVVIDLVQEGRRLLVLDLVADALAASLDIDIGQEDLLAFETGHSQHRG